MFGLQFDFMSRASETISNVFPGTEDALSLSSVGAGLSLKFLMPFFPKVNLVFRGTAGFYILMDSSLVRTGTGAGTTGLNGSSPGYSGEIQLELLQGHGFAIDGGVGYRSLVMSPITNDASATLVNADGSVANLDLSCLFSSLSLRFY
jgi:hypothetical protein